MSAAEKLRALSNEAGWEGGQSGGHRATQTIEDALPKIVAVVEAAQGWYEIGEEEYLRLPKYAQTHYEPIHEDETPTLERCFRLTALAALDEALS